jgi:hypothetical protein
MRPTLAAVAVLAVLVLSPPARAGSPAAAGGPDKLDLHFHFQKGQTYHLIPTVEEKSTQVVDGEDQVTTNTVVLGQTLEVLSVNDDGSATIKVTFGPTATKNEGPQSTYAFDSTDPPKDLPMPAVGLALVVGKSYTVTMTPAGEIVKMEGVDALIETMVGALPDDEEIRASMRESLGHQFGEDALKELLANITAPFPGKPVAVGDSWTQKVTHTRGMPRITETTYTLAERSNGVATVKVNATMKPDPDAEPVKSGPMSMRHTVEGTETGTYKLDEATGFILEGEIEHNLHGDVILSNVPGRDGDLTIPTTVEIKVTIKGSLDRPKE